MSEDTTRSTRQPTRSDSYRAVVAGTTVAGLRAGLALHEHGHDVTVARAPDAPHHRRVASVVAGPRVRGVLGNGESAGIGDRTTAASEYRYLAPDGSVESSFVAPLSFTASDTLERALGRELPADCLEPNQAVDPGQAPVEPGTGTDTWGEPKDGEETTDMPPDLFVAADGWLSPTRQRILPEVTPAYAGYVSWHGTLDEVDAPNDLAAQFADAVTVSRGQSDLVTVTVIPGTDGESTPGNRRLHWVWYAPIAPRDLGGVLTDRSGVNHDRAVPPGELQQKYVSSLHERASAHAPAITRLVRATPDPGVEPVVDLTVPRAVVGRTILVGDAAFTSRQHTGTSTPKSFEDATTLVTALDRYSDVDDALEDWAATQETRGRQLVEQGRQTDLDGLLERV